MNGLLEHDAARIVLAAWIITAALLLRRRHQERRTMTKHARAEFDRLQETRAFYARLRDTAAAFTAGTLTTIDQLDGALHAIGWAWYAGRASWDTTNVYDDTPKGTDADCYAVVYPFDHVGDPMEAKTAEGATILAALTTACQAAFGDMGWWSPERLDDPAEEWNQSWETFNRTHAAQEEHLEQAKTAAATKGALARRAPGA